MFPTGALVVFCGLLAHATAQLAGLPVPLDPILPLDQSPALPSNPQDLAGSLTGALSKGLLSGGLLDILENLPLLDILKTEGGTSGGLVGGLLGKLTSSLPILNNILSGLVGSLLELDVKLNITAELLVERDSEGKSHLVLGDCTHSPGSLRISLLNGIASLPIQDLVDNLTGILNKVLPELVQGKVCPLVNDVLKLLDVTLVHDILKGDFPFVGNSKQVDQVLRRHQEMFHTGGLVVFCGLLAQVTAQLAGLPVPLDPGLPEPLDPTLSLDLTPALDSNAIDLAGSLRDALSNGLLFGGLLDILEHLPLLNILKPGGGTSGGLVGLFGKLASSLSILNNILYIKVTNPQLLELSYVQSHSAHGLYVTIPLGMILKVNTGLVGSLLELDVKLNITAELLVVKDSEGKSHLVLGDCTHSPGSLRISLLNGIFQVHPRLLSHTHSFFAPFPIQDLVDNLTGILNKVLPELVQGKVCRLVNGVLEKLDIPLVHEIIRNIRKVLRSKAALLGPDTETSWALGGRARPHPTSLSMTGLQQPHLLALHVRRNVALPDSFSSRP
ncbi:BPI fold-containing family A member 1 [Marmota monax]|uniref:BPI fold-containing family A member 1 n=1 Tax=Marmota monax TaxID=9995 RepID=A0A834Q4K3_MARMO|nr:BPI fold-containing family A member 1 [Marmota monax]